MPTITAATPSSDELRAADRHSREGALALAAALPTDIVLYLLLPMYGDVFGVNLAETGVLLAANRLVRIVGYGWVARFYARRGDRPTCLWAVAASVICALGYATLSGFWALLPLRLLWGLSFAALNLATQVLATSVAPGAAARSGRSRAFIAIGPVVALPLGALLAQAAGPRAVFLVLACTALAGLLAAHKLPTRPHPGMSGNKPRTRRPGALDVWSFLEGFTLDGLFIVGLAYLGKEMLPEHAVIAAGLMMALRYGSEIALSPMGGRLADRVGAERLLVTFSLMTTVALIGFGAGWLWTCATAIVVLRALQLPLIAPLVTQRYPGPERVRALAARSVWRDIGAGTGPLAAGLLLPVMSTPLLYGVAALALGAAALACRSPRRSTRDQP